ncbi:unnamed protein product [Caenorhabditis brenneri]
MSKPSNSQNQTKSSTTIGSMCPSNSESFGQSGLMDTSAGSGNASANSSTPMTAKAPNSPRPTNDLPRESVFGRQGEVSQQHQPPPPSRTHPASCTNVTFENTNMSTASGSSNGKPVTKSPKSETSDSTRTAVPISAKIQVTVDVQIAAGETGAGADKQVQTNMPTQMSSVGTPLAFDQKSQKSGFAEPAKNAGCSPKPPPRSPAQQIEAIKKQQQMEEAASKNPSKKSMRKSQRSATGSCGRMSGISQKSGKSMKSARSRKSGKAHGIIYCPSLKSQKSQKSRKVINKGNGCQNTSVYMPGVMDGNTTKQFNEQGPSTSQKSQKVQNTSVYLYDGMDDNATKQSQNQGPSTSQKSQKIQNKSFYLPGVVDGNTTNQFNNQGASQQSQKIQNRSFDYTPKQFNNQGASQNSIKSPRIPTNQIPRADKSTWNMNQVNPTAPTSRAPNYCVYDVSELSATQRRLPPTFGNARAPSPDVGNRNSSQSSQRCPKPVVYPFAGAPTGVAPSVPAPIRPPQTAAPSGTNTKIHGLNTNQSSQRYPKPVVYPFAGAPIGAAPSVPAPIRPSAPQAQQWPQTAPTNTKIHGFDTIQNSQASLDGSTVGPPAQQSLQTRAAPTTTTTITIYGKKVDKSQSSQKLSQPVIPPMAETQRVSAPPTASAPTVMAPPGSSAPVGAAPVAPAPVVHQASTTPAQVSPQTAPTNNSKIVIFGKTADGKNTIQMTIDMQIVAGEALAGSDKPIQVIPQKILIAGKEFALDGFSKRGDAPP